MKKTIIQILFAAMFVCLMIAAANRIDQQQAQLDAQAELLKMISEDDPNTWDDVIAETDQYQNCIELNCINF